MTQAASIIASQIVPLNEEHMVLPNTAIAEIISFSQLDAVPASVKNSPDWLLGMLAWRGLSVPVIAFEKMTGGKYEAPGPRARLAVLNVVTGVPGVPFIAVPTQTIPQLMQIDQSAISVVEDAGETSPAVACHVVVAGKTAIIPDLDEVERQVAEVFGVAPAGTKKKAKKKK
jgi:chemosensory pili system protein ChpC